MPVAVGTVGQYSTPPRQTGAPQMDTDVSSASDWTAQVGVRVTGQDIVSGYVGFDSSVDATHYGVCFDLGITGTDTAIMNLSPRNISPRLAQYEEMYFFYAFREIIFQYIPTVTAGQTVNEGLTNIGSAALTMAVSNNNDSISNISDTTVGFQQMVAEIVPSVTGLAWEPMALTYRFGGKRVFETSTLGVTEADEILQGGLVMGCSMSNTLAGGGFQFGIMRVTYVIDFYQPSYVQTNPTLLLVSSFDRMYRALQTLTDCKDFKSSHFRHRLRGLRDDSRFEDFVRDNWPTLSALVRGFHSTRTRLPPLEPDQVLVSPTSSSSSSSSSMPSTISAKRGVSR